MENPTQPTLSQLLQQAHVTPELFERVQKETGADAGRMQRALAAIANKQYRKLPCGSYEFVSRSRANLTHRVNPKYEECTCEDCAKGHLCYHLISWMLLRESPAPVTPILTRPYKTLDEAIAYYKAHPITA